MSGRFFCISRESSVYLQYELTARQNEWLCNIPVDMFRPPVAVSMLSDAVYPGIQPLDPLCGDSFGDYSIRTIV